MLEGELREGPEPTGLRGEGFPEVMLELTNSDRGLPSTGVYVCHTGAGRRRTA